MPKPTRPRVPVPLNDIESELSVQLRFLKSSCDAYDQGEIDEYRRIALAIRILVHDTKSSKSLLSQLGMKGISFRAFTPPVDPTNLAPSTTLVAVRLSGVSAEYIPQLGFSGICPRSMTFEIWWNEAVFDDAKGTTMSREGFVLHTANQAGGAHVDPEIDELFHAIAKENLCGWIMVTGDTEKQMEHLEKATVRQIGHEVLATIEHEWKRILGNRVCDCGSGRKNRYCCGK